MLTVGSLFSGVGGIDLATERAGMRVLWQCEIDLEAQRVLRHHWPEVERHGDIRTIDHARLRPVDVVCGGVPCQDWSVAGRRKGLAGERSGLFFDFIRLADALAPRWLVFENVPGLLSAGRGRDFATVLGEITGYCPQAPKDGWRNSGVCAGPKRVACWRVLDARFFGVPQRRRRVFLVASAGNAGCVEVLFEPEGSGGHPAPGCEEGQEVAGSLGSGSAGDNCSGTLNGSIRKHSGQNDGGQFLVTHTLRAEGADAGEDGTGRGTPLVPFIVNAAESCAVQDHARQSDTARCLDQTGGFAANQGGTVIAFQERGRKQGRTLESQEDLAYNLMAPNGGGRRHEGNIQAGVLVRRLTPTECLRLQGLPDDWLDLDPPLSDSAKYRLIGNSVAVPCVEWIMRRLVAVDAAS